MEELERAQWRRGILAQMRNNGGEIAFRRLHPGEAEEFERLIAEGVLESVPDDSGILLQPFRYRLKDGISAAGVAEND